MKIRYFSDLHLEFLKPYQLDSLLRKIPPGLDEICVLAGDIGIPTQANYDTFMKFISKNFKKSFVIAGNHEYYGSKKMEETNCLMKDYFQEFYSISFLNNEIEVFEGYCFIGTTLWSSITNPNYKINDMYSIPHFDTNQYNQLNQECVHFLEDALQKNENCIVITHHMPSESLIDIKYKSKTMLPYNQWFYCGMDHLFHPKIKAWFYGHTHTPSSTVINEVPLLCNPIGYPKENHVLDFEKTVVLERLIPLLNK